MAGRRDDNAHAGITGKVHSLAVLLTSVEMRERRVAMHQ